MTARGKPHQRRYELKPENPFTRGAILCPALNEGVGCRIWEPCQRTYLRSPYPTPGAAEGGGAPHWGRAKSVSGRVAYPGREGEPVLVCGQGGGAIDTDLSRWATWPSSPAPTAGNPTGCTFAAIFQPGNNTATIKRIGDSRIGGNLTFSVNRLAGIVEVALRDHSNIAHSTTIISFTVGDWIAASVSVLDDNALCYVNGGAVALASAGAVTVANMWAGVGTVLSLYHTVTGATAAQRTNPFIGNLSFFGMWRRAWSVAEHLSWYADPSQMFRPVTVNQVWAINQTKPIDRNLTRGLERGVHAGG